MRLTRNDAVLAGCFAVVVGMVGASYAAVPLYYMFCRATGYGGTPNRVLSVASVEAQLPTFKQLTEKPAHSAELLSCHK
jgi:cytochrome c oxidase assembly protein Cox11